MEGMLNAVGTDVSVPRLEANCNHHAASGGPGPSALANGILPLDLSQPGLLPITTNGIETSSTPVQTLHRGRGRPRTKPIIYGPKRPRGRPTGSTSKKKKGTMGGTAKSQLKEPNGVSSSSAQAQTVAARLANSRFSVRGTQRSRTIVRPVVTPSITEAPLEMGDRDSEASMTDKPAASLTILQDEDPERGISDITTNDEETNADGAGIGADEEQPDEMEDNDLEEEGGEGQSFHRRPLSPWLWNAFNAHVEESKQRDAHGLPPLYANCGSFWFPRKSSFFILEKPHVTPPDLFNLQFFLWDPQALCKSIPCPQCKAPLQWHQHIPWPRRCVDLNSTFWIIGYRYRCSRCLNPRTQRRTVTYRSWDSRILATLPPHIADEFPALLSHQNAMSKLLFEWMRSCFQNGMGSKQFSDSLRVQHLLAYDKLHLRYLHYLISLRQTLYAFSERKYESFLSFDDVTPRGRHGFTPSSEWFRDMYDKFIEEHKQEFNQHMSMLTGEICAIDHSHKVTKHIASVNGEQVFSALLTVTNGKGEIRICNFVATKSHSQFEAALNRMRESLDLYGHNQPVLFYTDNMADEQFLKNSFPSLRKDVTSIEKYSHLNSLDIPSDIQVLVKDTVASINLAVSTILDDVSADNGEVIVGFDSEWNVELSPQGFIRSSGNTAIIQIAYRNRVYILQISSMISRGELPHKLVLFLSHPRIRKVGRLVNDLMHLQNVLHLSQPFFGSLDLAKLAKERYLLKHVSNCSLSDLCALVLHKRLDKNMPERISQSWENCSLTSEQISYAAKDAFVALQIYNKLISDYKVPSPLPSTVLPDTPVMLFGSDLSTIIAEGKVSPQSGKTLVDGVWVMKHHIVIVITRIHIPGAIVSSHQKRDLGSFGAPPFELNLFSQSPKAVFTIGRHPLFRYLSIYYRQQLIRLPLIFLKPIPHTNFSRPE